MTDVSAPHYIYTTTQPRYEPIVPSTRPVVLRQLNNEVYSSSPTDYQRRSSLRPSKRYKSAVLGSTSQTVVPVGRSQPTNTVLVMDSIQPVRRQNLSSAPTTPQRSRRKIGGRSQTPSSGVRIYDVYRPGQQTVITTTSVPTVEYTPFSSRRSVSTPHVNYSVARSYRNIKSRSNQRPKSKELYSLPNSSQLNTNSHISTTNVEPVVMYEKKQLTSKVPDRRSQVVHIYKVDQHDHSTANRSPDLVYPTKTRPVSKAVNSSLTGHEIYVERSLPESDRLNNSPVTNQNRRSNHSPLEIYRTNDSNYTATNVRKSYANPSEPKTVSITRLYPEPGDLALNENVSNGSSILKEIVVEQSSPLTATYANSHVFAETPTQESTTRSSLAMTRNTMRPTVVTNSQCDNSNVPSNIHMWSETLGRNSPLDVVTTYEADQSPILDGSKQSKLNQVGRSMLFSDLDSDSISSEINSHVYRINTSEPLLRFVLKRSEDVETDQLSDGAVMYVESSKANVQSFDPMSVLPNNESVTLLDPNTPEGPKLSEEGPVYMYVTRKKHDDGYNNEDW